jgi:hypothetical protein
LRVSFGVWIFLGGFLQFIYVSNVDSIFLDFVQGRKSQSVLISYINAGGSAKHRKATNQGSQTEDRGSGRKCGGQKNTCSGQKIGSGGQQNTSRGFKKWVGHNKNMVGGPTK